MYDSDLNIYKDKFVGTVTSESLIQFINQTVHDASVCNCHNLVHDMRDAKFQLNFWDEYTLFKEMLKLTHLTRLHKVAVIVDYIDDNGHVDYMEEKVSEKRVEFANIVGVNYGQKVWQFFEDYYKGIEWLLNSAKTRNHNLEIEPSLISDSDHKVVVI